MIQYLAPVLWIVFAVLIGVAARRRRRSFVAWLLLALLLSPLLAIILLLIFPPAMAGLTAAAAANPKAQRRTAPGASAQAAKRTRAAPQSESPGRSGPPRVLIGLAVLSLAILAPAVWFSTSLYADSETHSATVAESLSHSLSALTGKSISLLPSSPISVTEPSSSSEPVSDLAAQLADDPSAASAPAETIAYAYGVVNINANLRAGPGIDYALAGALDAGASVQIAGRNDAGDWYQLAGGEWIAAFLVTKTAMPEPVAVAPAVEIAPSPTTAAAAPTVSVHNANLRGGPGTAYPVVGSLFAGQELTVVGASAAGDWYQLAGGEWIYAELVSNPPLGMTVVAAAPP